MFDPPLAQLSKFALSLQSIKRFIAAVTKRSRTFAILSFQVEIFTQHSLCQHSFEQISITLKYKFSVWETRSFFLSTFRIWMSLVSGCMSVILQYVSEIWIEVSFCWKSVIIASVTLSCYDKHEEWKFDQRFERKFSRVEEQKLMEIDKRENLLVFKST